MNLLFIDDDPSSNYFHEVILEEYGKAKNYTFFDDPAQGLLYILECYKKKLHDPPTYIFLDLNMPKLDGWEILKRIEEHQITQLKLFILSTSSSPADKMRAARNPLVQDFICKPLSLDILSCLEKQAS